MCFIFCNLRSCCCGCSLKTGTLIIGILEMLSAAVGIALSAVIIYYASKDYGNIVVDDVVIDPKEILTVFRGVFITYTVIMGILFLISLMMLCGVCNRNSCLFIPFLIMEVFVVLFSLAALIVIAVGAFKIKVAWGGALSIIYAIIFFLIRWYYASVVYSHYKEIKRSNTV